MENITLYFRQGSSDKVYQAAIEAKDGGKPDLQVILRAAVPQTPYALAVCVLNGYE